MRIALVAYHGSVHTGRWADWFAARGHEVHVVTVHGAPNFAGDPADRPSGDERYEVHDVGALRFGKSSYLLLIPRVRRTLRRIAPDLVHAHFVSSCGVQAWASGVRPFACTGHGDDLLLAPRNPLLRWMIGRTLRASELITVPSAEMSAVVEELAGRVRRPVEVAQYGVEVDRLAALGDASRESLADGGTPLRIVCARAMLPYCHNDVLLRALGGASIGRTWTCDMLGEGPELGAVKALARRLGIEDRVTFHGKVPPERAEELLARAHVYVSLASRDGASIALLEALSMGSYPVLADIASNTPWVSQPGAHGEIVPIEEDDVRAALERAMAVDLRAAATANRALVRGRADRDTNLGRIETALERVVASA